MRVRMLENRSAAPDGVMVELLVRGCEYTLPNGFARRYIQRGLAEPVVIRPVLAAPEIEALPAAPEHKGPPARPPRAVKPRKRKRG